MVGLVVATFLLLLVLTLSGLSALSSIRGYVLGEGLWSKAQKHGVIALHRYARSGSEDDWRDYVREIELPLGDRLARQEVERSDPDTARVTRGFAQAEIPEEFHGGMALVLRRARRVDFVHRAIDIWAEADARIEELDALATRLREVRGSDDPDSAGIDEILAAIDEVDGELTELEQAFTTTLNDGAFQVERALRWLLLGIAVIVLLGAGAAGRYLYRQVQLRESVLERSEARYRTLFEESVVGTALSTTDGRVLRVNRAFAAMLGYDAPEDLVGRPASILYVNPDDREGLLERLREEGAVLMDELKARCADGSAIWLMTSSVLLEDPTDDSEQILATCLDITGRKEMEERLARRSRIEAMGQLAGGIAHGFNNLHTAIQGNASLLEAGLRAGDDEGVREIVADILASSRAAAALTDQLLAFSRGDPSVPSRIELSSIVRNAHGLLARVLTDDIRLDTDLPAEPVFVEAPPAQLEQVLLNLVLNAREAMPQGGRLLISVGRWTVQEQGEDEAIFDLPPGDYARLTVSDEGHGIPREARARLFEPFFSTKGERAGTGMGLATVYGIVTRAGGSVHVETSEGEGATFDVLLPLRDPPRSVQEEPMLGPEEGGGTTILLAEDEDAVRRVARRILERAGYRVLDAADGQAALELAEAGASFDLLVTDVVMPRMGGPELAARVAERYPDTPILFVSGYSDVSLDDEAPAGVRTRSLAKPFSPDQLLADVRALLEHSRRKRRA